MLRPWHCFNAPDCDQQRIRYSALDDINFLVGLTLWPPKESPARAGLSLLGDVVGGPLPTCRGVPQPTSPNLRIRVSLIRQLSAWTLCFERPPRHSRATTRPCSRAFLLRCMSQLMAQSGVSLRRQCLTAIGGEADIGRASRSCRSRAIDPPRTSAGHFAVMHNDRFRRRRGAKVG
jgi:hypothetical protein